MLGLGMVAQAHGGARVHTQHGLGLLARVHSP